MRLKSIVIAACMLFAASIAEAAPVDVTFTTSGSTGSWITDFSVTNNLGGTNDIYFFGVQAPTTNIVNSPVPWNFWGSSWNNLGYGGSGVTYNNNWADWSFSSLLPAQTLSGFQVLFNTVAAPASVNWFAYAYGGTYNGPGCFNCGGNPGFEGVAAAVPEPETYAMLLAGLGLLGFTARRRKDHAA